MALKLFKGFWFISLLAALGMLLFVYASLPEQVVIQEKESKLVSLPRDGVFYIAVSFMSIINVLVFVIKKIFRDEHFKVWFYGLVVTLNIFFVVALNMIGTFNSGESFNYGRIDFIIYGSVILVLLWATSWPFYSIFRKIFHKPTV